MPAHARDLEPRSAIAPEPDVVHEPVFTLQMNEAQCTEISFGRVPGEIQELAKTLVDWTYEDLRRNAAKPLKRSRKG